MNKLSDDHPKRTNRLIHETSPYLRQHAHNPVDWYPWGQEALEIAKREDKPILLSIGYAACHWCHVMEHESFENESIARLMNENFVCVKVDREERPDLDTIYMNAVQMMTGHGGWPMTVFLTPDQVPFYAGTYFPPTDRHGLPGFPRVLTALAEAYRNRRTDIESSAREVLSQLNRLSEFAASNEELSVHLLDQAARGIMSNFDSVNGGFGDKPKFPPSMTLAFLLRQYYRTKNKSLLHAVELTLEKMAYGGMYDQLGGGFHRYSTDELWLVPHFEKMLYDNALLSRVYLAAYLVTGKDFYKRVVIETLDYVQREMTAPSGGFYSTQDADSEGEEGKFFVWTPDEVKELLGEEDARLFNRYFDVSEIGNFEGHSVLHVDTELDVVANLMRVTPERLNQAIERGRRILFEAREQRIKPARDEKILTAWNGLMLKSFAEAARTIKRDDYRQTAIKNAEFLLANLQKNGRLLRTHKDGESKLNAYLEDYAFLVDGLLALYETTFDLRWFEEARRLADTMIALFWDEEGGGFFFTSTDHEALISRTKDPYDNATPSGNSVAADVLLRIALFTGESNYQKLAEQTMKLVSHIIPRAPSAFGQLLCAIDFHLSSPYEIAIIGAPDAEGTRKLTSVVFSHYLPNKVIAVASPKDKRSIKAIKLLEGRTQINGQATAYVCHNYYCEAPVTEPEKLAEQLGV